MARSPHETHRVAALRALAGLLLLASSISIDARQSFASSRGVGTFCGGAAAVECGAGLYCELATGRCCCNFEGQCLEPPTACPDHVEPVCGCDDVTYGNDCERQAAGVSKAHDGPCGQRSLVCAITSRLDGAVTAGSLQWRLDYGAAVGEFVGAGGDVACDALVGALAAFRDEDGARTLSSAIVDPDGMTGPLDVSRCDFLAGHAPAVEQLAVTVDEVRGTDLGELVGVSITVGDVDCASCGQPLSRNQEPVASDCLTMLKTSVGNDSCPPCLCDVVEPDGVFASDALACLKRAVGDTILLECPPCNLPAEELCTITGGRWDPSSCGHYTCGIPPSCQAIVAGCDCGFFRAFDPVAGCVSSDACGAEETTLSASAPGTP